MIEHFEALEAAELPVATQQFGLWLFAQYGGSGVCFLPRADLARLWRCGAEQVRRHCERLEKASGGLLRRVKLPGRRERVLLLFTQDTAGDRVPMGKLADASWVHPIGTGWSSRDLLALAAVARAETAKPTTQWGSTPPTSGVETRTPPGGGVEPHPGVGLESEPHHTVGLNPTTQWGPIKNQARTKQQQQQGTSLTSVTTGEEPGGASLAAAAGVFDFDRGHREALRRLGLSETDPLVGEILVSVAVPGATREVLAQRLTAALEWAETQRSGGGALRAAVDRGYLGARVDAWLAPKLEAELGIHEAPLAGDAAAGVPWDRDLESLVMDLCAESNPDASRRAAVRLKIQFQGDREAALDAHAEQILDVPEGSKAPCLHPLGISMWRDWVDRLRVKQAARDVQGQAECREVAG